MTGATIIESTKWALAGGLIGAFWGIWVNLAIVMFAVVTNPHDPSAGSVGIMIIFFLPAGILAGMGTGIATPWRCRLPAGMVLEKGQGSAKRVIAAFLAIFLGAFGIHKFYLGHKKAGLITLLLTVCTFGIGFLLFAFLGLVEGIFYLATTNEVFAPLYLKGRRSWF